MSSSRSTTTATAAPTTTTSARTSASAARVRCGLGVGARLLDKIQRTVVRGDPWRMTGMLEGGDTPAFSVSTFMDPETCDDGCSTLAAALSFALAHRSMPCLEALVARRLTDAPPACSLADQLPNPQTRTTTSSSTAIAIENGNGNEIIHAAINTGTTPSSTSSAKGVETDVSSSNSATTSTSSSSASENETTTPPLQRTRRPARLPLDLHNASLPSVSGRRPLVVAVLWCRRAVELLLQAGADPNDGTALAWAVDMNPCCVLPLLHAGASPVAACAVPPPKFPSSGTPRDKASALYRVLLRGSSKSFEPPSAGAELPPNSEFASIDTAPQPSINDVIKWLLYKTSPRDLEQFMLETLSDWSFGGSGRTSLELGAICYDRGILTADQFSRFIHAAPDRREAAKYSLPSSKKGDNDQDALPPPLPPIVIAFSSGKRPHPSLPPKIHISEKISIHQKVNRNGDIAGIIDDIKHSPPIPRLCLSRKNSCLQIIVFEAAMIYRQMPLLQRLLDHPIPLVSPSQIKSLNELQSTLPALSSTTTTTSSTTTTQTTLTGSDETSKTIPEPPAETDIVTLPLDLRGITLPRINKIPALISALQWGPEAVKLLLHAGHTSNSGAPLAWAVDLCSQTTELLLQYRFSTIEPGCSLPSSTIPMARQHAPALIRVLSDATTKQSSVPMLNLLLENTREEELELLCEQDFKQPWGCMGDDKGNICNWKCKPSCLDYAVLCFSNRALNSTQFSRFIRAAPQCDIDPSKLPPAPTAVTSSIMYRRIPPSVLYMTCQRGNIEGVIALLRRGANSQAIVPPYGETPLHAAAAGNYPAICKLLVDSGAKSNVLSQASPDLGPMTPIDYARLNSNFQLVRFLSDPLRSSLQGLLVNLNLDSQITSFSEIAEPNPPPPKQGTCGICLEESSLLSLSRCGHAFCRDCLDQWFKNSETAHLRCPKRGCIGIASYYDVLAALKNTESFEQSMLRRGLSTVEGFIHCPKCNYGGFAVCDDAICNECGLHFCVKCLLEHHPGASCNDMTKILLVDQLERRKEKRLTEEGTLLNKWMNTNARPCPQCKAMIQKDGGCSHMTCSHCKHQFCWLCMLPYISRLTGDQVDPCERIPAKLQFSLHYFTPEPQVYLAISGSIAKLGLWDPSKAVPMTRQASGWWTVTLDLMVGSTFYWKFVVCNSADRKALRWEGTPNRHWRVIFQDAIYTAQWESTKYVQHRP
ncbi:hypothetical protein Pelo_8059 [Pelomyxa schiedti]|nr:hypothetical protein Pelo_8059 [Pelomyxa schiedti]